VTEQSERERLVLLEARIESLTALLVEQRSADRHAVEQTYKQLLAQLTALATTADRFATSATVERNEVRLTTLEGVVSAMQAALVPRSELDHRLKGVADRQDTMQTLLTQLNQMLLKLNDEWTEEENERKLADVSKDRRRNWMVAVAAVVVAVIMGIPAFVALFRYQPKPSIVYVPATAPTTTVVLPRG
jgi:hypothetical protein